MSGTVGDLSVEQKDILEQFRKRMEHDLKPEEKKDDYFLLRWLRAREFDINKSEVMLRNNIKWRKDNKVDTVIQDFQRMEILQTYYPISFIGYDKDGSPVRTFDFGNMDLKGVIKACKKSDCVRNQLRNFEEDVLLLKEQSQKLGKEIETWYFIFDFENYSFEKATHKQSLELLISLFMIYEANYPERLKTAIIINASLYFTILFSIVKPLLSGRTLKKIKIFGKDGWKEELLKDIDADVLPAYLGGKRTDPNDDPRCLTIVKRGKKVPEEIYLRNPTRRLSNQSDVMRYTVSRKSKMSIKLEVKEPGSRIEWEFETEYKDICFGLYYQEDDSENANPKEIIPKQRVESHIASETGMFRCEQPGIYILMFDNTYSWLKHKEIFCRASVVRPSGEKMSLKD